MQDENGSRVGEGSESGEVGDVEVEDLVFLQPHMSAYVISNLPPSYPISTKGVVDERTVSSTKTK
jgi:hypothetical protein